MPTKYRKPNVDGTKVSVEKNPKGTPLKGTPDPGAIPNHMPLSKPTPEGQALVGTPGVNEKAGSAPQKGRTTPGRSQTKGLKGTPSNG